MLHRSAWWAAEYQWYFVDFMDITDLFQDSEILHLIMASVLPLLYGHHLMTATTRLEVGFL